jgi:chemotaxis protein methyltransferase CheR
MDPAFELDPVAYGEMSREVRALLGIDLDSYKPQQVWRRVTSFARRHGLADSAELTARLTTDPALRAAFRDLLTINVSEFFRDPDAWADLAARFLEPMLRSGRTLRAWSAGCSHGFEPYSLAMLADEVLPGPRMRIIATDIDEAALARTRAGRFRAAEVEGLDPRRVARYLVPDGDDWLIRPEIRGRLDVRRHDLTSGVLAGPFDLIVCRNVTIYLTEAAKSRIYPAFADALRPGGVLFVGGTEIVPNARANGLTAAGRCLYVRA